MLPILRTAWQSRNKRPLPERIQLTLSKFDKIWIVDGEKVFLVSPVMFAFIGMLPLISWCITANPHSFKLQNPCIVVTDPTHELD